MQLLRSRLATRPETISDFTLAAQQKYWEGMELALAGRRGAAIYLMGYAAEMFLKIAAFRFDGATLADEIGPRLAPAATWMRNQFPGIVPPESYHSLLFWMEYLRAKRNNGGHPLNGDLEEELVRRVRRLYQIWWCEMRYRPDQASESEIEHVYRDMTWLLDHFTLLWR